MATIRTLSDVPTSEKDEVINDFESEGAKVKVVSQGNDLWTITATFPDQDSKPNDKILTQPTIEPFVETTVTIPASVMGFSTNFDANNPSLLKQLEAAMQFRAFIEEGSSKFGFPLAIVAGIGSRESHWGLALTPPEPAGTGDHGHGHGLMQIDDRAHANFINTNQWKNPKDNIFYGCKVLSESRAFFESKTGLQGEKLLQGALAGYNSGPANAVKAFQQGMDVDSFTTGRDYSKDVIKRAGWFQLHGWV